MIRILVGRSSGLDTASQVLLTLDACLSQEHEYKNKISSYPVETGLDITDHVQQEPDTVKIEGLVSEDEYVIESTGTKVLDAYRVLLAVAGREAVQGINSYVKNEYPNPIMVDIITERYRVFTDMVCESIQFPFTVNTGESISFAASFRKIRKADVNLALVNLTSTKRVGSAGADRAQPEVDAGKQQTTDPAVEAGNYLRDHGLGWLAAVMGAPTE